MADTVSANIRLVGTDKEELVRIIDALSSALDGSDVSVSLGKPQEGRKGGFLSYGTIAVSSRSTVKVVFPVRKER